MVEIGTQEYARLMIRAPHLFDGRDPDGYTILPPEGNLSSLCYEDDYIMVLRDRVRFPDGHSGKYVRIVSPPHCAVGAAILPLVGTDVILLNQYRHATGQRHLEIPRGFGDPSETPIECARRELMEETSLETGKLTSLGRFHPDSGLLNSIVELFLFRSDEEPVHMKPEGGVAIERMSIVQMRAKICEGLITDSFTIAAFAKVELLGLFDGNDR